MGCRQSYFKREVYTNIILPQETRKISNKQSNLTPKGTRERRTKAKSEFSRRKEIIKIREQINEIETKKQWKRSVKTRAAFLKR